MTRTTNQSISDERAPSPGLVRPGDDTILSVERAFGIVKLLADKMQGLSLSRDLARARNLGFRQLHKGGFLDQCASILKHLAEDLDELVRLALVEQGDRITWIYSASGVRRSVRIDPNYLAAPTSRMQRADLEAAAPLLLKTAVQLARAWPIQQRPSFTDRRHRS